MALNFPLDPEDGQTYENFRWSESIGAWQFTVPLNFDDLVDVEIPNPQQDDLLYYNGTQWVNASPEDLNVGDADLGALFWMYA